MTEPTGGPLAVLARELVFFRWRPVGDDPLRANEARLRRNQSWVLLAVGALTVVVGFILHIQGESLGSILLVVGIVVLSFALVLVLGTLSRAAYVLAVQGVEIGTRALSVVGVLAALFVAVLSLFVIAANAPRSTELSSAIVGVIMCAGAVFLAAGLVDSSRAFVRADRRGVRHGDAKFRALILWVILVILVWEILQLAHRSGKVLHIYGLTELIVIVAAPVVFAFISFRLESRRRLTELAGEFGRSQSAAEAGTRTNASAAVKAQMRAEFIQLQVHLHANTNLTIGGIRVRRLIDKVNRPRFDAASFRVWKEDDDHAEEDSGGDEAARYPARARSPR